MWKDVSSFSRDDKEHIPNSWEYKTKSIRISIHRHIHYPKDTWLTSCYKLGIEKVVLKAKDTDSAKVEALEYVFNQLKEYVKELRPLCQTCLKGIVDEQSSKPELPQCKSCNSFDKEGDSDE